MPSPLRRLAVALTAPLLFAACSSQDGSSSLAILKDADGDGLPDALERTLGSDPRDPDSPYLEGAEDDPTPDGPGPDGIPDGLERYLRAGGSLPPITARTDSDGDQVPDYLEVWSGLDPRDPDEPAFEGGRDLDDPAGPAFDGVSDGLESYLLRRGARIPLTASSDSDDDGISDVLEVRSGSSPFDAADPRYARAVDLDGDQVPDWLELRDGFDPMNPDFPTFDGADDDDGGALGPDGDGVADGLEGWLSRSGAAQPVTTATDSDADGVPDVAEVRAGFDPFDPASPLVGGAEDSDGDGIVDGLERLLLRKGARGATPQTDSDRDQIADFVEVLSGSDPFDPEDPKLFTHFDLDGDGLVDFLEHRIGADAADPESPLPGGAADVDDATGPARDSITDAFEALLVSLGSRAPVSNYTDSDGDGLPDFIEVRWISDPLDPDSPLRNGGADEDDPDGPAGDGLSDAVEFVLGALGASGPQDPSHNSDRDVIPDAIELLTGSDWLDGESPHPRRNPDVDGDGVVDWLELVLGFDPRSSDDPLPNGGLDSDEDGLTDALEEVLRLTSTPTPVSPQSDSDGDGLYDHLEILLASERHDPDSPLRDGGLDRDDRTGPSGDGISDALEHFLIRAGGRRPISTRSDSDGDLIPDYLEVRLALDAFDADSPLASGQDDDDGDAVSNALEFVLVRLGASEPVDGRTDSDLDGAPDYLEVFGGNDAFDPADPLPNGAMDSDGDGLSDALEVVMQELGAVPPITPRTDTDRDGVPDGYEVRSGTHPLRADHPLANGGSDVVDGTGPADTISDALEFLLVSQGALAPVSRANDSDLDGAPDHLEVFAGSLPFDLDSPMPGGAFDTDGDSLTDALESVLAALGATAPVSARSDTDGDGAPDHFEVLTAAHPIDANVPLANGATTGFDSDARTGPNGDGLSDALELLLIGIGCRGPIANESDTDLDGLPDAFEAFSGTNPLDGDSPLAGGGADSDDTTGPPGDMISDALEAFLIAHGASGPVTLTSDTDGDGVPDFYEVFKGSDPFDALDEIAPGTRPTATALTVTGILFEGRTLTGTYRYSDSDFDPEGTSTMRWLRNGSAIPGASGPSYTLTSADLGNTVSFEVTAVSLFAYPPETAIGTAVRIDRAVPLPSFPRGTGGPGGAGSTLPDGSVRLWLRAGEDVATSGVDVTRWEDQAGYDRDAIAGSTRRPDLVAGVGPRATAAVRFDGASQLTVPRPVEDDFSIAIAFATSSSASNGSWWLSPAILGGETAPPCSFDYHVGINGGKPLFVVEDSALTGNGTYSNGSPHGMIVSRIQSTGAIRIFMNGTSRGGGTAGQNSLICPVDLFVGSSTARDGFWTGDLFEVCAFDHALNTVERRLVDNYMAARYGNTISSPLYTSATHLGEVTGIGRESDTVLVDQAEGAGMLRISEPTLLSDGDFLLWGTDRPEDFTLSTDVPAPYPRRLRRTWAYQITDGGNGDGVGTVNLRFRLSGLFLAQEASAYALLFDDDGVFADARVFSGLTFYNGGLEMIEFQGVPLGPERYFTLAVTER